MKVSHSAVAMTQLLTNAAVHQDWLLRRLFDFAARGLPLARLETPLCSGTARRGGQPDA